MAQPLYKRCKKGVGKSGPKKGRLLKGYIWPGGGKCPVKGAVAKAKKSAAKTSKNGRKTRARKSKPRSIASFHKSQAAAAGRYGAGAESFIRRQRGAAPRATAVIPKGSSYYPAQSAALNRIYGKNQSMAGARRRRRRR